MKKYGKLTETQTIEAINHWITYGKRGINATKLTAMKELMAESGWKLVAEDTVAQLVIGKYHVEYEDGTKATEDVYVSISTPEYTQYFTPELRLYAPWYRSAWDQWRVKNDDDYLDHNFEIFQKMETIKKSLNDRGWDEDDNKWAGFYKYSNYDNIIGNWRVRLAHSKGSHKTWEEILEDKTANNEEDVKRMIKDLKSDSIEVTVSKVDKKPFWADENVSVIDACKKADKKMPGTHGVWLEAYFVRYDNNNIYKVNFNDTNAKNWWAIFTTAITPINRPLTDEELIRTIQKDGGIQRIIEETKALKLQQKFWDKTIDVIYSFAESAIIESAVYERNLKELEEARTLFEEMANLDEGFKGVKVKMETDDRGIQIYSDGNTLKNGKKVEEVYKKDIAEINKLTEKAEIAKIIEMQKQIFGQGN